MINRTAIYVAEEIIKQEYDIKSTASKETGKEILAELMKIYSFKEANKEQYEKWNGQVSYDHPII